MSEILRKKLSGWGRHAKQPSCNDFCRVWSVNFRTYHGPFNQNRFSTENLFQEPKRAGMEKCRLVDLLWNSSAQQKMKLNFPPAICFMHSGSAVNPSLVSSSIWSSTILFTRATTEMHVFGFEASFTTQNNWKIRLFPKPVGKIAITSWPEIRASNDSLCYFAKYRFSFRKVQISQFRKVQSFILQSTEFHFTKYKFHFVSFCKVPFRKVP